jgi:hypothetical protein
MKECTCCHEILPLTEFSPCKRSADKLGWWCKTCKNKGVSKSRKDKPVNEIYYETFKAGKYVFF